MIPFLYPLLVDSAISRRILITSDQIGVLESSTWMTRKVPSSHLAHCNQSRFTGNECTFENEILELAMLRRGWNSHGGALALHARGTGLEYMYTNWNTDQYSLLFDLIYPTYCEHLLSFDG